MMNYLLQVIADLDMNMIEEELTNLITTEQIFGGVSQYIYIYIYESQLIYINIDKISGHNHDKFRSYFLFSVLY